MDYRPLDRARNEVRLLTIVANPRSNSVLVQCRLEHVSLDDQPEYVALSYAWGDANITRDIVVDGNTFEATENLHSALRHFGDSEHDIRIWIDAICINQKDLLERSQQVQVMQRIYEQAREVWVWLGEEKDDSGSAIDLIEALSDCQIECLVQAQCDYERQGPRYDATIWGSPQSWHVEDELVALAKLFARPWWHRIWVIQEVALSKEAIVVCGSRSVTWQRVVKSVDFLLAHASNVAAIVLHHTSGAIHGIPGLHRVGGIDAVRVILRCGGRYPILFLLSHHSNAGATDMRDKFIALAGLAEEEGLLDNNQYYLQPVAEVYKYVAKLMTMHKREGALDFLCYSGRPRVRTDLPSWTPDWSYSGVRPCCLLEWQLQPPEITSYYGNLDRFSAAGHTYLANSRSFSFSADLECLSAKGIRLDIVDSLSCNLPRPEASLFVSGQMAETCMEMVQPEHDPSYSIEPEDAIEALWRTFVMDKSSMGEKAPREWERLFWALFLLPGIIRIPNSDYIRDWYSRIKDFELGGRTVEQLLNRMKEKHISSFPEYGLNPGDSDILISISSAVERATAFRRIVTTRKGYLALAPADTRIGDCVCILLDCHVPLVLRPYNNNNHYQLIGESFVHGMMKGQAVEGIQEGKHELRDFDLR